MDHPIDEQLNGQASDRMHRLIGQRNDGKCHQGTDRQTNELSHVGT